MYLLDEFVNHHLITNRQRLINSLGGRVHLKFVVKWVIVFVIKWFTVLTIHRNNYLLTCICIGFYFGQFEPASSRARLLIEEDTLGFNWGKGPKSYLENAQFAADFPQTHWQRTGAASYRNRHLLDFHQSPGCSLNTAGCQTNPTWVAPPGTEVPDGIALPLPVATSLLYWGGVGLLDRLQLFECEWKDLDNCSFGNILGI